MQHPYVRMVVLRFALLGSTIVCGSTMMLAQSTVPENMANSMAPRAEARVTIHMERARLADVVSAIANQAKAIVNYSAEVIPIDRLVSVDVDDVAVRDALRVALLGTDVKITRMQDGKFLLFRSDVTDRVMTGVVVGRVTDARTEKPVRGVRIGLDGTEQITETSENGMYRLPNVSAGTHTLRIKGLGYGRTTRTVTVTDGGTVTMNVELEPSANPLSQVVVTGTVVATEQKAIPNAITIITGADLERRGITHIDQLFRGDVPGIFAQNNGTQTLGAVVMYSRGATSLTNTATNGVSYYTNPIKTYVDGVELANSQYLSQVDPRSIERIEILTGPQASTIYGSNAVNGVMQIFTKRGSGRAKPQITANLLSGFVQNNFSSALTPQHDYSLQVNGTEGNWSYNAGGSWVYMGEWTPYIQQAERSGFGGGRLQYGPIKADVAIRIANTQNYENGAYDQVNTIKRQSGAYAPTFANGNQTPYQDVLDGQTVSLSLGYTPTSWWSHELVIGTDYSNVGGLEPYRGYRIPSDTMLQVQESDNKRTSMRYATTIQTPITSFARLNVTGGLDGWHNLTSSMLTGATTTSGSLVSSYTSVSRQPGHNTGAFVQGQLGLNDALFLTYGLRAEWNPTYGAAALPNYAPRYGFAYTRDVGPLTAKMRASYGRSTRPPGIGQNLSVSFLKGNLFGAEYVAQYGPIDLQLANPDLGPEFQQGGEGGLELYWGSRGSVVITRYNQTVDALIASVLVDSMRSFAPNPTRAYSTDAQGYGYAYQNEYLNVGSIRNQGWELQGSLNTGPFTTKGTYSWTKSRVLGVDPRYRSVLTSSSYQPGASFQWLPEHTAALNITYAVAATVVSVNVNRIGMLSRNGDDFSGNVNNLRLKTDVLRANVPTGYRYLDPAYATADLNASRRFSSSIEGVLQMQNLTDIYRNDVTSTYPVLGRQTKFGLRLRW